MDILEERSTCIWRAKAGFGLFDLGNKALYFTKMSVTS